MDSLLLCSRCNKHLPADSFNKDRNKRGRKYWCRECQSQYRKEYYQRNRQRENGYFKRYYWSDREYHSQRYKEWYESAHAEKCGPGCKCRREVARRTSSPTKRCTKCNELKPKSEFYEDKRQADGLYYWCKQCFNAHRRDVYWSDPDTHRRRDKERRARPEVREKARERLKAWRQRNPEKARELIRRYQARKRQATVEPVDYEAIIKRDGMRCHICGKKIRSRKELHFDHIVPLSKGGEHSMKNIACAHAKCNLEKNDGKIPSQLRLAGEW